MQFKMVQACQFNINRLKSVLVNAIELVRAQCSQRLGELVSEWVSDCVFERFGVWASE